MFGVKGYRGLPDYEKVFHPIGYPESGVKAIF